jgi:pyruvate,water dikinase
MVGGTIVDLADRRGRAYLGAKAANLLILRQRGFRIPATYVCTWDAYARYQQDPAGTAASLLRELDTLIDPQCAYAVRSSANIEDGQAHSFAGQFRSVLNLRGAPDVMQAILDVWAETHASNVQAYLDKTRQTKSGNTLQMAAIVQEMVQPRISGVAFSRNPATGADEIVVEAVQGEGTALVQQGVTPLRWVCKRGKWVSQPTQAEAAIDTVLIQQVADETQRIARALKRAVDLEWVYDGQALYWLQVRDITTLKPVAIYSNRISREMFPGMIKPLIGSVNVPLVNSAWVRLMTEFIGKNDLRPEQLTRSFYYRAYFEMGAFAQIFKRLGLPDEALEMMTGLGSRRDSGAKPSFRPNGRILLLLPRLLWGLGDKLAFARRTEQFLPAMEARYRAFAAPQTDGLSATQLLERIDQLFVLNQQTAYFNIVGPLLMHAYNAALRAQLKKRGVDIQQAALSPDTVLAEQIDPSLHLARLHQAYAQLDPTQQAQIDACTYAQFCGLPGLADLQQQMRDFLQHFGHLSDSGNDFSCVPWRENPDLILRLIATYRAPAAKAEAPIRLEDIAARGPSRWLLRMLWQRARQFRAYRDRISFLYTYGYSLFRPCFVALGDILVQQGLLQARADIFYLTWDEVRAAVTKPDPNANPAAWVEQRKAAMERVRHVTLPDTIYGEQEPPLVDALAEKLTGTPTSRGYYTGPVKVVCGIEDFAKLQQGDVLAAPYSDVSWSPLFARAGAVVAESGGLLSHSSIIAREYGIPAVVSVAGCTRLADGTRVTVDGYTGEVVVHAPQDAPLQYEDGAGTT